MLFFRSDTISLRKTSIGMDCALAEKSVVHNNVAVQMKMRNLFFIVVIAILLNFVCDKFMFFIILLC